jgi:hypothetical protein
VPKNPSKSKTPTPAARTAGASGGAAGPAAGPAGGGNGPCKLTPIGGAGNEFQVPAASMPVSIALSTPDGKSEFLSVSIYKQSNLNSPLPNPPGPSATSFTLNLPALTGDNYVVFMVLGTLPSAKPVWITEACSGATKLDWVATPVNTTGEFALVVT